MSIAAYIYDAVLSAGTLGIVGGLLGVVLFVWHQSKKTRRRSTNTA